MRLFIRKLIVSLILIIFIEAQANKLFGLYVANEFDVQMVGLQDDESRLFSLEDKTNRNLAKEKIEPALVKHIIRSYISNRNLNSPGLSWVEPRQFINRLEERAHKYQPTDLDGFTVNNSARLSRGSDDNDDGHSISGGQSQRHRHYHNHHHHHHSRRHHVHRHHQAGETSTVDPREANINWFNSNRCSPVGNVRRIGTSGYKFPCLNKSLKQQQQQQQQQQKVQLNDRLAAAQRLINSPFYLRILAHIEKFADQISDMAGQMRASRSYPLANIRIKANKRDIERDNDDRCRH